MVSVLRVPVHKCIYLALLVNLRRPFLNGISTSKHSSPRKQKRCFQINAGPKLAKGMILCNGHGHLLSWMFVNHNCYSLNVAYLFWFHPTSCALTTHSFHVRASSLSPVGHDKRSLVSALLTGESIGGTARGTFVYFPFYPLTHLWPKIKFSNLFILQRKCVVAHEHAIASNNNMAEGIGLGEYNSITISWSIHQSMNLTLIIKTISLQSQCDNAIRVIHWVGKAWRSGVTFYLHKVLRDNSSHCNWRRL